MPCDIRCCTHQSIIADSADFYHIITDQTMTSLNQLQSCLTFTNTTFSCNQHTDTIYIHQHTMNGNTRCKLYIQPAYYFCHECGGYLFCDKYRNISFFCFLHQYLIRPHISAEDQTRNTACKKLIIDPLLFFRVHPFQKCILYISDDLDTLIVKMIKIAGQL